MDDNSIVQLYWQRCEDAIAETNKKYGKQCYRIAYNVLGNNHDAEESVSDTYMKVWSSIPPQRPACFSAFLYKITRNLSINRWRSRSAEKRGGGEIELALEELDECLAHRETVETEYSRRELRRAFRQFLAGLPDQERDIFLRRYWSMEAIGEIAADYEFSQSKVSSMLYRSRLKLRSKLEQEDLI